MIHGYIPPHRFLPYLSWTEISALPDRENTVIVLPVGAIEQHGPHLPCSVDSVISSGVLGKALERLPVDVRARAAEALNRHVRVRYILFLSVASQCGNHRIRYQVSDRPFSGSFRFLRSSTQLFFEGNENLELTRIFSKIVKTYCHSVKRYATLQPGNLHYPHLCTIVHK